MLVSMNTSVVYSVENMETKEVIAIFGNRMQAFEYSNWLVRQNCFTVVFTIDVEANDEQ